MLESIPFVVGGDVELGIAEDFGSIAIAGAVDCCIGFTRSVEPMVSDIVFSALLRLEKWFEREVVPQKKK